MVDLVGHFLVFSIVAIVGLVLPLIAGLFVRPKLPTPEKDAIYECGEPTIGSSYIQFDLRFYVVALLFIIFDVEVAFFFPWALGYGAATQLADTRLSEPARVEITERLLQTPNVAAADAISPETALNLATFGLFDILVFFGVLLVGFAYVWKRGDLDWVRAVAGKHKQAIPAPGSSPVERKSPQPVS